MYRLWIEDSRTHKCILVLQVLQDSMIILAHDYMIICMDLVGPIHTASSQGNKYILMVIDMLTGLTMPVPIQNKNADTICGA